MVSLRRLAEKNVTIFRSLPVRRLPEIIIYAIISRRRNDGKCIGNPSNSAHTHSSLVKEGSPFINGHEPVR